MRIGELNYSGKATKLIAALMVCILVFTLAIPAQPAEAVAGTTIALAAGLTLAFVAACGVAFTVNEAQNSSTYWEGQIEDYMSENSYGSVDEWADFSQVTYNSGILGFPGVIVDALLSFFNWFTGKNGIEAGSESEVLYAPYGYLEDEASGTIFYMGHCMSIDSNDSLDQDDYSFGSPSISPTNTGYDATFSFNGHTIRIYVGTYFQYWIDGNAKILSQTKYISSNVSMAICENYGSYSIDALGFLYVDTDGRARFFSFGSPEAYGLISGVSYTVTASDVIGLPDLEEKETELGYVPDVNIPLPEVIYEGSDAPTTVDEASTAVLDYAGTAGNILDLDYEYANTDTNVDTGTDTDTNEGTQEGTGTDAETGTQSGTLTLENVAADSLVEVAPETMLEDDTLLGLFISKFPWCIPFDLYYAIAAFAADPVAPEFEVNLFEGVSWEGLDLSGTEMTLSFEAFEKVAAVTRWSTLIIFCAGLAMITKRMIWS